MKKMIAYNQEIAIIGAGPVGLTMARLLQRGGANVAVYGREADATARIGGGTLDLHKGTGQAALQKAGLLGGYFDRSLAMGVKFADESGQVLATRTPSVNSRYDNPEINRTVLRNLLLESLPPDCVHWGKKLIDLQPDRGRWRLKFGDRDHTYAHGDIVIVANGGMSGSRQYVTDAAVEESGSFIVQGDVSNPETTCPELFSLCDGHRLMVACGGYMLVINPLNNGSLTYGLIFSKPDQWEGGPPMDFNNNTAVARHLILRLSHWSALFRKLFEVTEKFTGLPSRILPMVRPWKTKRPLPVTLIGDAAHLMPPFAGMGVNIGMLDALTLSECLLEKNFKNFHEAIADYEARMFVYAAAASQQSRENEAKMRRVGFDFRSLMG